MSTHSDKVLAVVVEQIRSTIDEDWVEDFDIDMQTRFNDDLELESIEFVKIADALQNHFGNELGIINWLSGKSIHELIGLSVGDLVEYIASVIGPEKV